MANMEPNGRAGNTGKGTDHHEPEGNGLSAIVPAYNAAQFLEQSLSPLLEMNRRGEILEVIVVDDGSTDSSAQIAKNLGAKTLSTGGRKGVGVARNIGADSAKGSILWFVDADVVVHDDAVGHIVSGFEDPGIVSVIGSYDDQPPARNFLSQYKNLVHHHYHHQGKSEASTYWAGCGAIRKAAFMTVEGFDTDRYTLPSIEDIELGYRLRAAGGRILLVPELQGTHLKVWRFANLIHTEIFRRAIPWTRLMLERGAITNDLNVSARERFRAVLAGVLLILCIGFITSLLPWWWPALGLLAVTVENWALARKFYMRNGALFAVGGLLFHQLYYLYSSAAFAWCLLESIVRGLRPGIDRSPS